LASYKVHRVIPVVKPLPEHLEKELVELLIQRNYKKKGILKPIVCAYPSLINA
jgi:hypothetical protein